MKKIITILTFIVLASGLITLFVFANIKQENVVCSKFEIDIDYDEAPVLINTSSIKRQITRSGIRVKGQQISTIQAEQLRVLLQKNPYIKNASVSIGVNGIVRANILQRTPAVRIIDRNHNHYLIDKDGYVMPVNDEFPIRILMANGNIGNPLSYNVANQKENQNKKTLPKELEGILKTALSLNADSFTQALIEQIYLNKDNEIELIPKIGNQTILLGDTTRLQDKLHKLKIFYTQGMKNDAWEKYKTINLKYQNQVVCTK